MTELYLIRHGNAKKLQRESYVTAPLTALGRKQADLTGAFLNLTGISFDGYYCSPLKRAVETATIIGSHIGQTPGVRLGTHEMEYREIPCTVGLELFARTGILNHYFQEHTGQVLRHPFLGRVSRAVTEILKEHPTGRIALVAHGGVIVSIMAWYMPHERQKWWRASVGNCSFTRLEIVNHRAELLAFDETVHLGELQVSAHQTNYSFSADTGL